jgi:hypothetical protein
MTIPFSWDVTLCYVVSNTVLRPSNLTRQTYFKSSINIHLCSFLAYEYLRLETPLIIKANPLVLAISKWYLLFIVPNQGCIFTVQKITDLQQNMATDKKIKEFKRKWLACVFIYYSHNLVPYHAALNLSKKIYFWLKQDRMKPVNNVCVEYFSRI